MTHHEIGHILDIGSGPVQVDERTEADISNAPQCEMPCIPRMDRCPDTAEWILHFIGGTEPSRVFLMCGDHKLATERLLRNCPNHGGVRLEVERL